MDDLDSPSSDQRQSISLQQLQQAQVTACCWLEAVCFNELRRNWDQPLQVPRREDWLSYQVQFYPENCTVALSRDEVVGYSMVHIWGSLGWMGPVVVDKKFQGEGLGKTLVHWSLERMKKAGCRTAGLETWPYHVHNIGLYLKEGFLPGPLTVILEKPVELRNTVFRGERLFGFEGRIELLDDLAALSGNIVAGLDYRPLLEALTNCKMGEVLVWLSGDQIIASACLRWKAYTDSPDASYAVLEMLTVRPGEEDKFEEVIADIEGLVAQAGRKFLQVQLSSHHGSGLLKLINVLGYRLVKTRLRMYAWQQAIREETINFSSLAV